MCLQERSELRHPQEKRTWESAGNQKASRAPFTHRHGGKQGRLRGGGDPAGEPGRLCRSLAGGGQSRGFPDQFLQRRVLPSTSQQTVHRRQFPAQLGGKGVGADYQGFPTDRALSHTTH